MTNKMDGYRPTSDHKQECKEIYIYLFNIYSAKISGKSFGEKIKLINQCKNSEQYMQLSVEEQDKLFNELLKIK